MSKVFSSLSNPESDLPELANEFDFLINFFSDAKIKKRVDFNYTKKSSVSELTTLLIKGQNEINLFHFSGHSGKSGLDFSEQDFSTEHVARLFNTLGSGDSHIQCVFLNGCENANIIRRLSKVPVVIGTKTKIQDSVASKFTKDFFGALIEGKSSYEKAFESAVDGSNLPVEAISKTRSESGGDDLDASGKLNDYFMVINNPRVAARSFPFKTKTNWVKYIFLLFALIALFLGFFFRDALLGNLKGYSCASIRPLDPNKCNFVIADITGSNDVSDFNQWLYENIQETDVIKKYLNPINIETFRSVIFKNRKNRNEMPDLCNYDFNLTGTIIRDFNGGIVADFNIEPYPDSSGSRSLKSFKYVVQSLHSLDSLITVLNTDNDNVFVLYNMCVSCALTKQLKGLPELLSGMADHYNASVNPETYQRMELDLADINLLYKDTASAIISLDKASRAAGNDLSLTAMEKKIDLFKNDIHIKKEFESRAELAKAYEERLKAPQQFNIFSKIEVYKNGLNTARLGKADLVLNDKRGELDEHDNEATKDIKYLKKIKFIPSSYHADIHDLLDTLDQAKPKFHFGGNIQNANGQPIEDAMVQFENIQVTTDINGDFDFGIFYVAEAFEKMLTVSKTGFNTVKIEINQESIRTIKLLPASKKMIFSKVNANQFVKKIQK